MKAGYLGPKATFTDIAVQSAFPWMERIPFETIPDCLDAVNANQVDVAVVPLENTLEGSVHLTVDYLYHESNPPIVAEITVPIQQHLMVHPENQESWRETEKVFSHPHAIAQCHKFLHGDLRGASVGQVTSTAAAAKYVSDHPELKAAAIANELAAEKYQLSIVKRNIHDLPYNHTRFIAVSSQTLQKEIKLNVSHIKTTVMVTLPSDRAGALHQVLSAFAWRSLNLSKIESRPLKTGLGNYFFMIDILANSENLLVQNAIQEIEAIGCTVKVLGGYASYEADLTARKAYSSMG
ncbi:prephenate dehydratase [Heyndrickxia acidicola]|uniref:Prephenate dehydratase n=1 Tax=Heyndrickxia acidicola TaxID=209389 RepID=A0ABU6MJC2_9BACI|nr:prephenate dehydratase [Heyndrickxia acidicola]MED1204777.1 prephenate dehydratase [Heyndrickxia acidicola]